MLAKLHGNFRLTKDAELTYGTSGTAILKVSLACSEKRGDNEDTLFIDGTAFGRTAEIINQYAGTKGNRIYLEGKLKTESWQNQQGEKRSKISFIINEIDFIESKAKTQGTQAQGMQQYQQPQHQQNNRQNNGQYVPQNNHYVPPQQPTVVHENIHANQQSMSFDSSEEVPF